MDTAKNISYHIRVQIAALPHDTTATYTDIRVAKKQLTQAGKQVDLFEWHGTKVRHAKLFEIPAFQQWISSIMRS